MYKSLKTYIHSTSLSPFQNTVRIIIPIFKNQRQTPAALLFSFLALCSLLFAANGCGYSLHGRSALPFHDVAIGIIENNTVEPKLQDSLTVALTQEFLKEGITVTPAAQYRLSGVIHTFSLRILSEKSDVAAEYEVTIKGDFRIIDASGKITEMKQVGSPFIVSFPSSGQLNELIAFKEQASNKALQDMAAEIVANLIYR
jgi:hypothetical protein